jgi:hypothetical protein
MTTLLIFVKEQKVNVDNRSLNNLFVPIETVYEVVDA